MSACNAGDPGSIPGFRRSPGEGNGNSNQYSCLENPTDRGAWYAPVHGVTKSGTQLSDFTFTFNTSYPDRPPDSDSSSALFLLKQKRLSLGQNITTQGRQRAAVGRTPHLKPPSRRHLSVRVPGCRVHFGSLVLFL